MEKLNEYQDKALTTEHFPKEYELMIPALGLAGEAGEAVDKIKKVFRDYNGELTDEMREAIAYELGDSMWYIAVIAQKIGYTLLKICEMNIEKIDNRCKRGTLHGSGDNR